MAKRPGAEFERDLEAVFEDRARDFSSELRQLLEQLWLEGVREGRSLERQDQVDRMVRLFGHPARLPQPLNRRFVLANFEDPLAQEVRELKSPGLEPPP